MVDSKCRALTSSWIREQAAQRNSITDNDEEGEQNNRALGQIALCDFFEGFDKTGRSVDFLDILYSSGY